MAVVSYERQLYLRSNTKSSLACSARILKPIRRDFPSQTNASYFSTSKSSSDSPGEFVLLMERLLNEQSDPRASKMRKQNDRLTTQYYGNPLICKARILRNFQNTIRNTGNLSNCSFRKPIIPVSPFAGLLTGTFHFHGTSQANNILEVVSGLDLRLS